MINAQILATGLGLVESPRWHDDWLWFADWSAGRILTVDVAGNVETIAEVASIPLCIGFLPGGELLVVAGDGRVLRRRPDGSLVTHADLTAVSTFPWNDVAVTRSGNAYVGNICFDFPDGEFAPGILALVSPEGAVRQVADDLHFPNGMVVTPDDSTLIVAESYGGRLTAFDIDGDGGLSGRRVWAELPGSAPDGICLAGHGDVWYADVPAQHCRRVREGGDVLDTVELDRGCFACAVGGPDNETLFITAAEYPGVFIDGPGSGQVVAVSLATSNPKGWR